VQEIDQHPLHKNFGGDGFMPGHVSFDTSFLLPAGKPILQLLSANFEFFRPQDTWPIIAKFDRVEGTEIWGFWAEISNIWTHPALLLRFI